MVRTATNVFNERSSWLSQMQRFVFIIKRRKVFLVVAQSWASDFHVLKNNLFEQFQEHYAFFTCITHSAISKARLYLSTCQTTTPCFLR